MHYSKVRPKSKTSKTLSLGKRDRLSNGRAEGCRWVSVPAHSGPFVFSTSFHFFFFQILSSSSRPRAGKSPILPPPEAHSLPEVHRHNSAQVDLVLVLFQFWFHFFFVDLQPVAVVTIRFFNSWMGRHFCFVGRAMFVEGNM